MQPTISTSNRSHHILASFASSALLLLLIAATSLSCCVAENLQPQAPASPPAGILQAQYTGPGGIDDSDRYLAEKRSSWNNLHSSWGKRRPTAVDDILAARLLNSLAGRESSGDSMDRDALNDLLVSELLEASRLDDEVAAVDELYRTGAAAEKRAWKNMNGAWGKRVSGDWNKFRGK